MYAAACGCKDRETCTQRVGARTEQQSSGGRINDYIFDYVFSEEHAESVNYIIMSVLPLVEVSGM